VENYASSPWFLLLSASMGIGCWLICRVLNAWWIGNKIPKDMSRWVTELEFALRDLHGAEMHRASCYRRLADMIGEMPKEFDAIALTGMVMSDRVGIAILERSEELGIYPRGTFAKLGVGSITPSLPSTTATFDTIAPVSTTRHPTILPPPEERAVTPWIGTWEGGRLVPPPTHEN
jgi:hypothetical protein